MLRNPPVEPYFTYEIDWRSVDHVQTKDGTGVITARPPYMSIRAGNVIDNDTVICTYDALYGIQNLGKKVTIEFIFNNISSIADTNAWLWASSTNTIPPTETNSHVGFKIINDKLYASSSDDVAAEQTEIATLAASVSSLTLLKIITVPTVYCDFYINDVFAARHTVRPVTTQEPYIGLYIRTKANAVKTMIAGRVRIKIDA